MKIGHENGIRNPRAWTIFHRFHPTVYSNFQKPVYKTNRGFLLQITDAAEHNTPVTEKFGIKFTTSILECSAIYTGIFFRNIFRD
jgi:hypothetical protein